MQRPHDAHAFRTFSRFGASPCPASGFPSIMTPARTAATAFALLAIAALIPLAVAVLPPILDYPNHLARMHILAGIAGSEDLQRHYSVAWRPIPDLALDVVVPQIGRLMPVDQAMRLALAAILLGLAGGCTALHRMAFRRWSLWPMAAFLLLYNRMLLWGFLNYLAGLALVLWGLAAWIALERRPAWVRVLLGTAMATAIWFAHLAAFGCYALALLAYAASERGRPVLRRLAPAAVTLIPGAVLFLLSPTSGAPSGIAYGNPLRKLDLPVSIFDNYDRIFDGATFAVLLIAALVGLGRRAIILHERLRWSLIALLVAFLLLPSRLFATAGIDHRLPIAIGFLFVASSDWSGLSLRSRRIAAVLLASLLIVRLTVVTLVWRDADREYQALIPAFDLIDRGDAVAVAAPAEDVQAGGVPLLHFPALAITRRDAFVPILFADPTQQPVQFTEGAARLAARAQPAQLWQALARGAMPSLPGYNDLVIVDPPASFQASEALGTVLFAAPRLVLVRLNHATPGQIH
jgi:hypothetical protein